MDEAPVALHELTLAELAAALAAGAVSSVEATEHALRRIEALDGRVRLNAFVTVTADQALADARVADARRTTGASRGPLDGIPLALKDLFDTAGVRTTAASRCWADRVPTADATVVRRLRDAGAVLLGKTNLLEFAYGYPHPDFGETVNPWDRGRTAGGSSGGSAAAVAAGLGWGALGSDTGGSIRSPAAYCGITGLKPTYGLVSLAGAAPLSWSLDHAGPMTRTAADCALMLAAIAGHDPSDPYSAPPADAARAQAALGRLLRDEVLGRWTIRVGTARWPASGRMAMEGSPLRGLRIGAVPRYFELAVSPGLRSAVESALSVLSDLGATVVSHDLDQEAFELIVPALVRIYTVEAAVIHRDRLRERPDDFGPVMRQGLEEAIAVPAVDYAAAQLDRVRIRAAFAELYDRVDLLAWPAQPLVAPPLGTTSATVASPAGETATIEVEIGATGPANLTGEPSITIPCGFVDGLPVGLLLQAPPFADALVLRAALAYQAVTGVPALAPDPAADTAPA